MIEGDIKGCFDAIDHHVLMDRVRRRIGDRKVLRLILAFLKAGIMIEGTVRHPVTGTPQGRDHLAASGERLSARPSTSDTGGGLRARVNDPNAAQRRLL